jgi:hypothetical protein
MQPFYIGIGSGKNYSRAKEKRYRNNLWHKIVNKAGYQVQILLDDLSWEEAIEKEKEFIALYGRINTRDGILCNMTDGGEGMLGNLVSDETRKKLSNRVFTDEHRKNMSESAKGNKNCLGRKLSEKTKLKISDGNKRKKMPEEAKQKISESLVGNKNAKTKKVINIETNKEYLSLKQMCDENSLSYSTMKQRFSGRLKNNTLWRYA